MALSDLIRGQIVRDHLARLEAQRFDLEVMQVTDGAADDDDAAPGVPYGVRRKQIDDAIARIVEGYGDLLDETGDVTP